MPKRLEAAVYDLLKRNLVTPKLSPEIRAEVAGEFREDVMKLQDLLGRDLSAWLAPST
jgi:hypothetical protein